MPNSYSALDDILSIGGLDRAARDHVQISGTDPVLPTNFFLGTAGAAVIAATGIAAANIWELRTGRRQDVSIDVRHAANAMRSDRYLLRDGEKLPSWDPVSGIYQGRDERWIQLHCNFPHHRQRTLDVLGAENDPDAVAAAVAEWNIPELEERCTEAGTVVGMVRTPEDWAAHPQSAAVDRLPLYEVVKIGDSEPEPFDEAARPLEGVRVMDLTRVIAGPMCGRTLAEHGADVMRISGPGLPFSEALVMDTGFGKKAAEVDLRDEPGKALLSDLVRQSDVFSQGYRPGTIAGRGFAPEALVDLRPGIVCVSLCAYGHEGPWAMKRGFDSLVQSCSGIVHEQSAGTDGTPRHLPAQALDYITGYLGAFGAMEALRRRAIEGGSYHVRVSLVQTAHWIKRIGRFVHSEDARGLPDPVIDDVMDLTMETESSFGMLRHLKPAVMLSETPPYWASPPVPLASHEPAWAA